MPTQVYTDFGQILVLVEARLQAVTGLPAERIKVFIGDKPPHLQGDQDLVLRPAGWQVAESWTTGGGRTTLRIEETLEVRIRTRLALDHPGSAREWLLNASYGHLRLRVLVLDALHCWLPTDADDNVLTTHEVIVKSGQSPREDGTPKAQINWGEERVSFLFSYLQTLTQFDGASA